MKQDRRAFLALTGLTPKEFSDVLPAFVSAYQQGHPSTTTLAGNTRHRRQGGGRRGKLASPEQKLLFILVYLKTYPLQVVMGELFGMSQAAANQWIHRLLPILQDALKRLDLLPERDGTQFAQTERAHADAKDYIIDGTERRRQRPADQAFHRPGK